MSMNKADLAEKRFEETFCCGQSVFSVFAPDYGLDEELALRIAEPTCVGFLKGETCGSLVGAMLVIGLAHGRSKPDDDAARDLTRGLTIKLQEEFEKRNNAVLCRDLLGVDTGTAEGIQHAKDYGLFDLQCPNYVRDAVEIVEALLKSVDDE